MWVRNWEARRVTASQFQRESEEARERERVHKKSIHLMWMRILYDIWIGSHRRQSRTNRCSMLWLWRVLRLWPKLLRFWWFPGKSKAWFSLSYPAELRFTYFCRQLPLSHAVGLILLCTSCQFLWMVLKWCTYYCSFRDQILASSHLKNFVAW